MTDKQKVNVPVQVRIISEKENEQGEYTTLGIDFRLGSWERCFSGGDFRWPQTHKGLGEELPTQGAENERP